MAYLAIFGAASSAFSATVVHITGSTAYRANTNTAILKSFDNGTTVKIATTNASLGSSGVSFFHGTMNGVDTIVETKFTGSVGGIKAVTSGAGLDFFPDDTDTRGGSFSTADVVASASPTPPAFGAGTGLVTVSLAGLNTVPAEVTMSDTYQAATLYRSPTLSGAVINGGAAPKEIVGVVPFIWMRTPSADASVASITNMNRQVANLLYGNGTLPLAFWSGSALPADQTALVYAAGRDPDSGTRLTTFAETGLGANATVVQYNPSSQTTGSPVAGVSTSGSVTGVQVFPDTTVANLNQVFTGGNAGEASGGSLAGYMGKAFAIGTPGALIAYSGTGDASGAIQAGAIALAWDGVSLCSQPALGTAPSFTAGFDLIRNGKYTFWGYEHVLYLSGIAGPKKVVADKIATQIYTTDAQILMSTMNVSRRLDGSLVGPNY